MSEVKKKNKKRTVFTDKNLVYILCATIAVLLILMLNMVSTKEEELKSSTKKLKVPEGATSVCQEDRIYLANRYVELNVCEDGDLLLTIVNNDENTEDVEVTLMEDVTAFYNFTDMISNDTTFYILSGKGKVYSIQLKDILNGGYKVAEIEGVNNIITFREMMEYKYNGLDFSKVLYAQDDAGNLYKLQRIY